MIWYAVLRSLAATSAATVILQPGSGVDSETVPPCPSGVTSKMSDLETLDEGVARRTGDRLDLSRRVAELTGDGEGGDAVHHPP